MDLTEAKELLRGTKRSELRDNSFGDIEILWMRGTEIVAQGYFGGTQHDGIGFSGDDTSFTGEDAMALLNVDCGKVEVTRNDETGPDNFKLGVVAPGLTKEAVLEEITRHPSNPKKES